MAFEKRDLSGAVFKNKKPMNENSPNMTGNAMIDGVEYWVNGWTKTNKDGEKWISLAFKRKDGPKQQQKPEKTSYDIDADSIPF